MLLPSVEIITEYKIKIHILIDDRMVYMKGIDASYFYENYTLYKTENIKHGS